MRKIHRILLIQPPNIIKKDIEPKNLSVPLGIAYLAAVTENDYEVKLLDTLAEGYHTELNLGNSLVKIGLSDAIIMERIKKFEPDIVGVSCLYSIQFDSALDICKIAKSVDRNIITVMGGVHPSAAPAEVLANKDIDLVVIGEGEKSFPRLISGIEGRLNFNEIDGIAYKVNGNLVVNPKSSYIDNLDEIPFPARHLLPMDIYFEINRPHASVAKKTPNTSMVTSRGCPAKCVFCAIHASMGTKFRGRSAENVIKEIEFLVEKYGIKEIQFEDDNLTYDNQRSKNIFNAIIKSSIKLDWCMPNGVALYTLSEELLRLMKKSGCYRLGLPIESGNQEVLNKIIKKPLNLNKVKNLIQVMKKLRIKTDAFFIIGTPGESLQQIRDTFKFLDRISVDNVCFYFATPYPGSELFDICTKNGYLERNLDLSTLRTGEAMISTPDFKSNDLERLVSKEMIKFRIKLLFRDPIIFWQRVVVRLFKDTRYFFHLTLRLLKNIF